MNLVFLQPNTSIFPGDYDPDNKEDDFLGKCIKNLTFSPMIQMVFGSNLIIYINRNVKNCLSGPDGELRAFLNGLAEANDVPNYVKDHPFGEAAITPSHSDWGYYSKIIRSLGKE